MYHVMIQFPNPFDKGQRITEEPELSGSRFSVSTFQLHALMCHQTVIQLKTKGKTNIEGFGQTTDV